MNERCKADNADMLLEPIARWLAAR